METKDVNGKTLATGDSVIVKKDLDVKGSSIKLKRGTKIKNIRLIAGDTDNVECKVGKAQLVLKTCFLQKS